MFGCDEFHCKKGPGNYYETKSNTQLHFWMMASLISALQIGVWAIEATCAVKRYVNLIDFLSWTISTIPPQKKIWKLQKKIGYRISREYTVFSASDVSLVLPNLHNKTPIPSVTYEA